MIHHYYETFITLAETSNFSLAAKKLFVAQSTVSSRIKEIEKYYDQELFSRDNKSVALTVAGEHFLQYAIKIVALEQDLKIKLSTLNYKNRLRVGSPHAFYIGRLRKPFEQFMSKNRDISLNLQISHTPLLLEALSDDLIDIAAVAYVPKSSKISTLTSFREEVILVAKNDDNFLDEIQLAELHQLNLLHSDLGHAFDLWIKEQTGKAIEYQLFIDQISEMISYTLGGYGYSFMMRSIVEEYIEKDLLKEVKLIEAKPFIQDYYLVVKKEDANNDVISLLLECIDQ